MFPVLNCAGIMEQRGEESGVTESPRLELKLSFCKPKYSEKSDGLSRKKSWLVGEEELGGDLLLVVVVLSLSTSEMGLCVFGSMPLCLSFFFMFEFHRFLISLSVLPGSLAAICDHLIKNRGILTHTHDQNRVGLRNRGTL